MDGLFTKMQITGHGADSQSICRKLINGIEEERQTFVFPLF